MKRVAHPPAKPLMIFDGDCLFCRRWIARWREQTGEKVDYISSQKIAERFPEISREEFSHAVQFIEPSGEIFSGAAAVFHSLGHAPGRGWLKRSYERVPGFALATETAYAFLARRRGFASAMTRLLWGDDVRRPTYFISRRIFLRALGVIFLIAFLSLWSQIDGLVGSNGIAPAREYFTAVHSQVGTRAYFLLPTLCWLNSSDAFLHWLCGIGAGFSLILAFGFLPPISLVVVFISYLSLAAAGQDFLSFQWDILLLEAGFLTIFLAPWRWRFSRAGNESFSRIGFFLLQFLLFKLMFMSGAVKLTSGDDSWANLTALNFHYQTQPLPTVLGWWAQQTPEWFRKFSTAFVLVVEIACPFFISAPRRLRLAASFLLVLLQVLIALTGNYAFFNLLTVALCLLMIDDGSWARWCKFFRREDPTPPRWRATREIPAFALALIVMPVNLFLLYGALRPEATWPKSIATLHETIDPFRIANGYGLFRVMTKTRPEIVLEGSADGIDWLPYEFRWKPGNVMRAPLLVAPHQPRLDWQMWFAALGGARQERWFGGLVEKLLEGSPPVTRLLQRNPFPAKPPRYIRALLFRYEFTTREERGATGAWWKREELGEFLRPVSLSDR